MQQGNNTWEQTSNRFLTSLSVTIYRFSSHTTAFDHFTKPIDAPTVASSFMALDWLIVSVAVAIRNISTNSWSAVVTKRCSLFFLARRQNS